MGPNIRRRYPPGLVTGIAASLLTGRHRSFLQDAAALCATLRPPLQVHDEPCLPFAPLQGKLLVVFNHYARPSAPAWWTAITLGGGLARAGLTQPEPRWVMTATWRHLGIFAPISQWALRRIATIYNHFLMPPMPPDPSEIEARAATVRQILTFVRHHPDARVCLAPEGRDSGDGHLIAPPDGAGRFILQLCRTGMALLPAGVCEDGGAWHVRFGPMFALDTSDDLASDARDEWASCRVMQAIADLLPERLRGIYAASGV